MVIIRGYNTNITKHLNCFYVGVDLLFKLDMNIESQKDNSRGKCGGHLDTERCVNWWYFCKFLFKSGRPFDGLLTKKEI